MSLSCFELITYATFLIKISPWNLKAECFVNVTPLFYLHIFQNGL